MDTELEALGLGEVIERALDEAVQVHEPHLTDVDDDGPGLDLGQVQNVVDEIQEVVPGRVNGLGEFRLPGAQVSVGVLRELIGEDQQAIQGGAELVRHIREKFRLVLRVSAS